MNLKRKAGKIKKRDTDTRTVLDRIIEAIDEDNKRELNDLKSHEAVEGQ